MWAYQKANINIFSGIAEDFSWRRFVPWCMCAIDKDLVHSTDLHFVSLLQFLSGVQFIMHRKSLSWRKMRATELFTAFCVVLLVSGTLPMNNILQQITKIVVIEHVKYW